MKQDVNLNLKNQDEMLIIVNLTVYKCKIDIAFSGTHFFSITEIAIKQLSHTQGQSTYTFHNLLMQ